MTAPILDGAEAWSADGGPHGVLVLHGFTGNPHSMRGIAEVLAKAGFAVELPLLPGHGTSVEDLIPTGFSDWSVAAAAGLDALKGRLADGGRIVVVGLSMGGALTLWLASDHPELAGIVGINAVATAPEGMEELVQGMLDSGEELMDGIGSDIADPESHETAYPQTPLRPLLTLLDNAHELPARMARIACPVLLITSRQDHVVEPGNSDVIASSVAGPVERVWLERSFHVAPLDHDRDEVERLVLEFCERVVQA